MGLREAREKAAARQAPKPKGALAGLRAKRVNGSDPKPKGALAALAKKKKRGPALAGLRAKRQMSSQQDFRDGGITYHNCRIKPERLNDRPWGTVDVSNGDITFTFHNRHGAWFHDVPGKDGYMKEPVNFEITRNIQRRWDRELKAQGIPTATELRAQREAAEREAEKKKQARLKRLREAQKAKKKAATTKTKTEA